MQAVKSLRRRRTSLLGTENIQAVGKEAGWGKVVCVVGGHGRGRVGGKVQ